MSTGRTICLCYTRNPGTGGFTRSRLAQLAPAKNQHRLAQLDFIALLKRPGLIFIDRLPVDLCPIRAALVSERVVAIPLTDDRGMQPSAGPIFQEHFASAPPAQC